MQSSAINYSIERTLSSAIYIAIDNRDEETFKRLDNFFVEQIQDLYQSKDILGFGSYTSIFAWYYEYALDKLSESVSYKSIYKLCAYRAIDNLQQSIPVGEWYNNETDLVQKRRFNSFGKIVIDRISDIIYVCIRKRDFQQLPYIFKRLDNITRGYTHFIQELRFQIIYLKDENPQGKKLEELSQLNEKYEVDIYIPTLVRRVFKVTLFWSYYLYYIGVMKLDDLTAISEKIAPYIFYYIDISSSLIDIFYLRNHSFDSDVPWQRWDYTERPDGEVYTPPSVRYWVTFGAVIHLLKTDGVISYNVEDGSQYDISSFDSLLSAFEDILKSFTVADFDKWGVLIGSNSPESFTARIERLKSQVKFLREKNTTERENQIARLQVDDEILASVKEQMRNGYENSNWVIELFSHFGNITYVTEAEPGYYMLGEKNKVWTGIKTSFVREPEFHVPMMNVDIYGTSLQKQEENSFLISIQNAEVLIVEDLFEGMSSSIQKLLDSGFKPSMILVGNNIWYSHIYRSQHEDYRPVVHSEPTPFSMSGGDFKEIPIVRMTSDAAKDRIIISDFAASFHLTRVVNSQEEKKSLVLDILPIDQREASRIIDENPEYWTRNTQRETMVIKLQNSLKLDFYTVLRLQIANPDAYKIIGLS